MAELSFIWQGHALVRLILDAAPGGAGSPEMWILILIFVIVLLCLAAVA